MAKMKLQHFPLPGFLKATQIVSVSFAGADRQQRYCCSQMHALYPSLGL